MLSKTEKAEQDIDQDVILLADTLDEVLRSSASKTKEELSELHSKARGVLLDARSRLNGSVGLTQHVREVADHADSYVRGNPWQGVGMSLSIILCNCQPIKGDRLSGHR
ncbi:DUF883 family protein, partial [Serratia aquatilis]